MSKTFKYDDFYDYYTDPSHLSSVSKAHYFKSGGASTKAFHTNYDTFITVGPKNDTIFFVTQGNVTKKELYFGRPEVIKHSRFALNHHYSFGVDPEHQLIYFHRSIQNPYKQAVKHNYCYLPLTFSLNKFDTFKCIDIGKKTRTYSTHHANISTFLNSQELKWIKEILSRPFEQNRVVSPRIVATLKTPPPPVPPAPQGPSGTTQTRTSNSQGTSSPSGPSGPQQQKKKTLNPLAPNFVPGVAPANQNTTNSSGGKKPKVKSSSLIQRK